MTSRPLGILAVWLGVAVAIAAPASQALTGWGLTASEFSGQGDSTLRVAGYAFSIWGIIYAGMLAYAIRRLTPRSDTVLEGAVDGPLALASLGCGVWIVAAGLNLRWFSVLVIAVSLAAALVGLIRLSRAAPAFTWPDRLTVLWPLALLAGWLTAASVLNLVTVLTAEGLIDPAKATVAALAGIGAAGAIALATLFTTGFVSYALPVAWGLVGAFVAERGDQPIVAYSALACAALLLLASPFARRRGAYPRKARRDQPE